MAHRTVGATIEIPNSMWAPSIQYEFLELLGEGGQGRVFKALRRDRETGLCETVALKVLHSETAVSLWKHEFESLRKVRSPYCVQVLSFDRVRGRPALVLEFVDGVALTHLGRSCVLDEGDIIEILAQIEAALKDLNNFELFHGDLSPANVLIDHQGSVKLLDFGLANNGGADARLTPEFAAPERLAGQQPSLSTDLYSLGSIESFLRGRQMSETDAPDYLAIDPSQRRVRGLSSCAQAREQLAKKINLWQKRSQWARNCRTKTLQAVMQAPRAVRGFLLAAAAVTCILTSSAALTTYQAAPPVFATLIIRTLKWHRIQLDGRPLGYSPLTVTLAPSKILILSWVNASGGGRKALRVQPGQRIVMDDRDFVH